MMKIAFQFSVWNEVTTMKNQEVLVVLFHLLHLNQALQSCNDDHAIVETCSVEELYLPPMPVEIQTMVYLNDIHGVDEVAKSISIYVELEAYWIDPGISISGNDSSESVQTKKESTIWFPTLIFENILGYKKMSGYGGTGTYSFWYFGDHEMYYSEEVELKIFCNFDFSKFPFDSHICPVTWGDDEQGIQDIFLKAASVRYEDSVTSSDETKPIVITDLPYPFEFQLESIPSFVKTYDTNYSYTGMTVKMKRSSFGLLLSGYYYPTGSFALLSQISFLINVDMVIREQTASDR